MSDDKTKNGSEDASRINLSEESEVHYWAEELKISEARLRQLVQDHGDSVEAVMSALGK